MWFTVFVFGGVAARDQFPKVLFMGSLPIRVLPNWNSRGARGLLLRSELDGSWGALGSSILIGWMRFVIIALREIETWFWIGSWMVSPHCCFSGLNLQILWDHSGGCCPCCHQKRSKNQLALQSSAQTQGAAWAYLSWEKQQRFTGQRTSVPQSTSIPQGNLEEKQHPFTSPLPLISLQLFYFASFSEYYFEEHRICCFDFHVVEFWTPESCLFSIILRVLMVLV